MVAREGFITPTTPQGASPAFVTAKTDTKARLIMDLRSYNKLFPRPPRFRLPQLAMLLDLAPCSLWFVKLDVANFYWSSVLPSDVLGVFFLSAGSTTYTRRYLTFGCLWSPLLAQRTLESILQPVKGFLCGFCWQYVDDVLLF